MPSTRTLTLPLKTLDEEGEEGTHEIGCIVEFTSHKAHRGYRDSLGVPEEPNEPAGVEIDSIKRLDTGEEVTDKELDSARAEEILWKDLSSDYPY